MANHNETPPTLSSDAMTELAAARRQIRQLLHAVEMQERELHESECARKQLEGNLQRADWARKQLGQQVKRDETDLRALDNINQHLRSELVRANQQIVKLNTGVVLADHFRALAERRADAAEGELTRLRAAFKAVINAPSLAETAHLAVEAQRDGLFNPTPTSPHRSPDGPVSGEYHNNLN